LDIRTFPEWLAELNDSQITIRTVPQLVDFLDRTESLPKGILSLCADAGPRAWWERLFGAKRFVVSFFAIEWSQDFASVIFHDEYGSEYRALDQDNPVAIDDSIRNQIAHGELTPHPIEECMKKARAFAGVRSFVSSGERPDWFTYRYVG
jgi:hypothetical protein